MTQITETYQRTYSLLVDNEPGVLNRVAGLFSARGYNILSLTVGETQDPTVSRMTIVSEGTKAVLDQIAKQVAKLIPVLEILPIKDEDLFVEELLLIKVKADSGLPEFIEQKRESGESIKLVYQGEDVMIVRLVSDRENENRLLAELKSYEIIEICRTGEAAMSKTQIFQYQD